MRAAFKNNHEGTNVNLVDDACASDMQNIFSLDEPVDTSIQRRAAQASLKHKKKYSDNKGSSNRTSETQYFTIDSEESGNLEQQTIGEIDTWRLDSESKTESKQKDTDDLTHIAFNEKRNLGTPFVINALTDGVTSINLPKIFEPEQMTKLDKEMICDDTLEKINSLINIDRVIMTDAKSGKSKYNDRIKINHLELTSSVPSSITKNDESEDANRLKAASASNTNNPIRNRMHKKYVKNNNLQYIDHNSSTEASSPRRKNVNSHQHMDEKAPKIYCLRNLVIVIMKSGSRFCFTGKLLVKVLYGAVKIYGSVLNKSIDNTEVYSPRGYSNVVIETSEEFPEDSIEDVWTALDVKGITRDSESKLQIDVDNVQPGTAVLVLQNFENNLTHFLKTYFTYFRLFPNVKNPHYFSWTDPKRAEIILQARLRLEQYNFNYRRLIVDSCITTDIAERMLNRWRANEWSCTLIAGGKSVGKSTSMRYLINSLLGTSKKVVLIDVDPGQAECTPPGCISYNLIEEPLMGPNFTHLKAPVYQLFIDDVDVSRCVTRYLEGIKMLIEKLKECPILSRLPVVVNTMGFTKSLGWNIIIFTIKLINPSIILQIMSSKKKNNYDNVLSAAVVNNQKCSWTFCDETFIDWNRPCEHDLCLIYSQAEAVGRNELSITPHQGRELVMLSYLSSIVHDKNDSPQYNTELSFNINEAVPYTAPFSSLCIIPQRLFGVPASRALNVINGNIVALCGIDLTEDSPKKSTNISNLQVLTQRSPLCTCYGFGIVRGVDMERQEVFIITPLPISIMQHVNCLAGCIPVPPVLLQLHQGAPYVGGNAELPTSREPRRGYFKMKYQNKNESSKS
ncbi:PREDICTED: polynucleotide 5'-hydroxyl-kinase NOL9 [Acromyrmex echinatior]|uniref:Polynucleotide 5'-hydroxyl-kinase NOL9 n=1 Tax=Acromyrmex echinatior TaxID=103372 RepID=F4X8H4_ACREC|nr:PREDICTED: polynucleotide 5'-hydroxyl-kinase NOL9 [Acromyrmex echinatior]EGI57243.1 Nucleolar protein 9 [Acromyrmex echinatior]